MPNQLEMFQAEKARRREDALIRAMEYELNDSIGQSGVELLGFSVRLKDSECLLTIRGNNGDGCQVSFVGAVDMIECVLKAVRDANSGRLIWREDKYNKN